MLSWGELYGRFPRGKLHRWPNREAREEGPGGHSPRPRGAVSALLRHQTRLGEAGHPSQCHARPTEQEGSRRTSMSHHSMKSVKSMLCEEGNSGTMLRAQWNRRRQNTRSTMWARRRTLARERSYPCSRSSSTSARLSTQSRPLGCRNPRTSSADPVR